MCEKMKKALSPEQALGRAATLCSGSEHCVSQVQEKLASWGISDEDAARIMKRLEEEKYVDNRRYSRAYCHDKFYYNHWGRVKIGQMLRHLCIGAEDIAEGLATIPDLDYEQTIIDLLRQKNRSLRDADAYQRKGKLVRHLLSRGFEMHLVLGAVDAILGDSDFE